ncbi:MAG: hypothetical protein WDM81_15835 [Rhizomicrobium sp.]
MLGLEGAVGELDVEQAARHRIGRAFGDLLRAARQRHDSVLRRRIGGRIARQAIALLRRPFIARAAAQHGVQAEQDHRGDHGEDEDFQNIARSALS